MARLVTLDVTGTCIRIIRSPGHHYAKIAKEFDLEVDVHRLNIAFKKSFKAYDASHACYGCRVGLTSRDWWQMVIRDTFSAAGIVDNELCNQMGKRIYKDFDGPQNWELFPEVVSTLKRIKAAGAILGVISNFDERLSGILNGLGIATYFNFVLASYEVKYCKPDPKIFQMALEKAKVAARDAIHVGDNYEYDYLGARAIGMKPLLLRREYDNVPPESTQIIDSLLDILPLVKPE